MKGKIEKKIAALFSRRYCVLTGSGTAAIYCILKGLELSEGAQVLYPINTCETAVNAAIFAGLNPVFSDVDIESFNLSDQKIIQLTQEMNIPVVMGTHLFGQLMDFQNIEKKLAENKVILIEDAAQAYGGEINSKKAGQIGLASIISFGPGKLLDCSGGGAILTDTEKLHQKVLRISQSLHDNPQIKSETRQRMMKEMFVIGKQSLPLKAFLEKRKEILRSHSAGYLLQINEVEMQEIEEKISRFSVISSQRETFGQSFRNAIEAIEGITIPNLQGKNILWRFSFLVQKEKRDYISEILSDNGFRVSKLFEPMIKTFNLKESEFPNAVEIGKRIINIHFEKSWDSAEVVSKLLKETLYEATH